MEFLFNILLLCSILICVYFLFAKCINRSGIEINHIFLFSIGYIFYYVIPIIVGKYKLFHNEPGMDNLHKLYGSLNYYILNQYLIIIILIYLSFMIGTNISEKIIISSKKKSRVLFNKNILNIHYKLIGFVLICYVFKFRNSFFKGNTGELSLTSARGTFIAVSLVLLALAIIYCVKNEENVERIKSFIQVINNKFMITYIIIAILILSLGGRLYFMSTIFMLMVYKSVYHNRFKIKTFFIITFGIIITSGIIGVIRFGSFSVNFSNVIFNVFAETLYTSFTVFSFLGKNTMPIFNIPVFLGVDFISLVPRFIWPAKGAYLLNPIDYGYYFQSPYGALNSFVSFMINFGIIGTIIFIFLFAFFLNYLKTQKNSIIGRTMYILISGFLVFTFYRDDFSISLVKNILQFSILTPIFIVVSAHILTKMSGRGFSKIAIYEWFKKIIGKTKFRMKKRF